MSEFQNKTTTQKGNVGEKYIIKKFNELGWSVYQRVTDCPHDIDFFCYEPINVNLYVMDIKSKSKRKKYDDTGIDIPHYNKYKNIQEKTGHKAFLLFIDEEYEMIYGGKLDAIEKNKYESFGIMYFQLKDMSFFGNIPNELLNELKNKVTKKTMYINDINTEEKTRVRMLFNTTGSFMF